METMVTLEERVQTLEQDYIEQKKFRKKFDSIISLEVAPTENGRVSLRDNDSKEQHTQASN